MYSPEQSDIDPITRWLEITAKRPKNYIAEDFGSRLRSQRRDSSLEVLTKEHAQRLYTMVCADIIRQDPDWLDDMPRFGAQATADPFFDHPMTKEQEKAAQRVLCAIEHSMEVDYCPLLLDLVPILLMILPEAVVYAVIRNMHQHRPFYFGTIHRFFLAAMASFRAYMHKYFPETAYRMALLGADTDEWLGAIFYRCFVPLISYNDLVHLMDLYLEDGLCFFFRMGLALFKDMKWKLKALSLESPQLWWDQLADWTFSWDFEADHDIAHILQDYRHRVKRKNLERLIALRLTDPVDKELITKDDVVPLRLMMPPSTASSTSAHHTGQTECILSRRVYLKLLASFLSPSQRQRSLSCCYSSERHGRSLETLYRLCKKVHPCFLIIEEGHNGHVIGAYLTDPIHTQGTTISGTGSCFIFRLTPPAAVYRWHPDAARALPDTDVFQLATTKFFAVGAGRDSDWPAIKIDLELENGSSHASKTFNSLPLCGRALEQFSIQRLEVYHLVAS